MHLAPVLLMASLGLAANEPTLPRRAVVVDQARQDALAAVLLDEGIEAGALVDALTELGPAHLPELFSVLIDGRLIRTEEGGPRLVQVPASKATPVRLAIAAQPHATLSGMLESVARRSPTPAEQQAALGVLGGLGERDDLDLLIRLGEPQPGAARLDRRVREAFGRAFASLSQRHDYTPRELSGAILEAHPSLVAALLAGFERCETRPALEELAGLLGRVPEADALVLARLGATGEALPSPLGHGITSSTRTFLSSARPEVVVEAVVVAGKLRDVEAIGDLVGLTFDPVAGRPAMTVLKQLSGQRYGKPESWEAWYSMELAWWEQRGSQRLDLLSTGTPAEVAEVLMEVSRKPLFRDRIAVAVMAQLGREQADLVKLACAVLGHLRSGLALPELEALAGHPDPGVRAAAAAALKSIVPDAETAPRR